MTILERAQALIDQDLGEDEYLDMSDASDGWDEEETAAYNLAMDMMGY